MNGKLWVLLIGFRGELTQPQRTFLNSFHVSADPSRWFFEFAGTNHVQISFYEHKKHIVKRIIEINKDLYGVQPVYKLIK